MTVEPDHALSGDHGGRTGTGDPVAVVGAGGFVGSQLVPHLIGRGHPVRSLVRRTAGVAAGPGVELRTVDVSDTEAVTAALEGCTAAYYLVHAMAGGEGFAHRDRDLARSFAEAAAAAGVGRIVYLGGLGRGELSEHLASRQEVGRLLGSHGVAVVELRAAVVLGAGSISFEMVRYLTERLPMMVCPRWVNTKVQPIALGDLLEYLSQSLDVEPGVYEIGCPDVTTYREMMDAYARVRGLRRRLIVKVPVLSPSLSAHWVDLVTPVDQTVSHALIESLTSEVTVEDPARTDAAFTVRPLDVEAAIGAALDRQADSLAGSLFARRGGLEDGVYTDRSSARVPARQDHGPASLAGQLLHDRLGDIRSPAQDDNGLGMAEGVVHGRSWWSILSRRERSDDNTPSGSTRRRTSVSSPSLGYICWRSSGRSRESLAR